MVDVVDRSTRSRMMAGIQGKNTRPELTIRRGLHAAGFRYRLHSAKLPGKPDLVFPGRKSVIFVNGCFWHGHRCHLFKWPSTRRQWWRDKINATRRRDRKVVRQLHDMGWRVLVIWECALKGKQRLPATTVIEQAVEWLGYTDRATVRIGKNQINQHEIRGTTGRVRKKK